MHSTPTNATRKAPDPSNAATGDNMPRTVRDALALAGAWSDLRGDDEFEALDRIRHETKPSPQPQSSTT